LLNAFSADIYARLVLSSASFQKFVLQEFKKTGRSAGIAESVQKAVLWESDYMKKIL
jgi:hypothetical protein